MGMFTEIEVYPELLPKELRHYKGWQTKDVIEPNCFDELVITKDGELIKRYWDWEWEDNKKSLLGGFMKRTTEYQERILFHGDLNFYEWDTESKKLIDLIARFTNGKLEWIRQMEVT